MSLALEFKPYRTAFATPFHTAHGEWTEREGILIRLTDVTGRSAFGEIAPIPWFGTETLEQALELCRLLGSEIDAERIAAISDSLPCCQFAFGSALEALDEAPGTSGEKLAEIARLLPTGVAALTAVQAAVERGFTRLKWKVGIADSAAEQLVFRELVGKLPTGTLLRLDANGAWDLATAESWIAACEGAPVEFIEQPLAAGQDDALMKLGAAHKGFLALDESVTPPGELLRWLDRGWPGVVVVKPSLGGPPDRLRRLLAKSAADVVFTTALETKTGWHNALRFALGHRERKRVLGFGAGRNFLDASLNPPEAEPIMVIGGGNAPSGESWKQPTH